jgi:transcriptional regulator with XRE-family HTH domain
MSEREAFGPGLRRVRVQRGITVEQIAAATKVSADLWTGLERNDLSRWPGGIYARAYVRAYAVEIGADPEATVDEFCRCFPTGDRRTARVVREQAALIGHDLNVKADLGNAPAERRAEVTEIDLPPIAFTKTGRIVAASADACAVIAVSVALAAVAPLGRAASVAACAFLYHGVSLALLGCTPAAWTIETYVSNRHPSARRAGAPRFLRLVRNSERVKV